jgi:hypothetical protein
MPKAFFVVEEKNVLEPRPPLTKSHTRRIRLMPWEFTGVSWADMGTVCPSLLREAYGRQVLPGIAVNGVNWT